MADWSSWSGALNSIADATITIGSGFKGNKAIRDVTKQVGSGLHTSGDIAEKVEEGETDAHAIIRHTGKAAGYVMDTAKQIKGGKATADLFEAIEKAAVKAGGPAPIKPAAGAEAGEAVAGEKPAGEGGTAVGAAGAPSAAAGTPGAEGAPPAAAGTPGAAGAPPVAAGTPGAAGAPSMPGAAPAPGTASAEAAGLQAAGAAAGIPPGMKRAKAGEVVEREAAIGQDMLKEKDVTHPQYEQAMKQKEEKGLVKPGSYVAKVPKNISEKAHRLMQSGNYGIGTPFGGPRGPKVPKHLNDTDESEEAPKPPEGVSKSVEIVHCFQGHNEVPCPNVHTGGEDGLTKETKTATMEGIIQLAPGEAIVKSEESTEEDKDEGSAKNGHTMDADAVFETQSATQELKKSVEEAQDTAVIPVTNNDYSVDTLDVGQGGGYHSACTGADFDDAESAHEEERGEWNMEAVTMGSRCERVIEEEGDGENILNDVGGCESVHDGYESVGGFESVMEGGFESTTEAYESVEERLKEVNVGGEQGDEQAEKICEGVLVEEETAAAADTEDMKEAMEAKDRDPERIEREAPEEQRKRKKVGIMVRKREPSPPKPEPEQERPKCDDPECRDCQLGAPVAQGKPRQGGLKTTIHHPAALERERRDIPPCDPAYAEQYMMYAQQYAAYAQHFAMYAQYCAQQGQPQEPPPRQLNNGPPPVQSGQHKSSTQLHSIAEECGPQSSCCASEGSTCTQDPSKSEHASASQAQAKSGSSASQQVAPKTKTQSPQEAVAKAQPSKEAVAKAQPKAKEAPKPIMITPYRHNWLISGVHNEAEGDGEKTWTQEIRRFTGFDLEKLYAQCRTCMPIG